MPKTVVRVYGVTVDDVTVRRNEHVPSEVIVDFGDEVAIHGRSDKIREALVDALTDLVIIQNEDKYGIQPNSFLLAGEPFKGSADPTPDELTDEPIDGTGF